MIRLLVLAAVAALAADPTRQTLTLVGRPFTAVSSADGASLFVSTDNRQTGAITVFHATPGGFERANVVTLRAPALEMALVPDGSTLVVANDSGIALVDAAALAAGKRVDVRYVDDEGAQITAVNVSRDGRFAFASEERRRSLAVIAIGPGDAHIVGRVGLDGAPVGIAVSPEGATFYVTSESSGRGASTRGCLVGSHGTISTVDTARAETDPDHARIARNEIGCSPVRVQLSPAGDFAWVTLRGEDHVAAYATSDLQTDGAPKPRALVSTGSEPVGIFLARHGTLAIVANSARFEARPDPSTFSVFSTEGALASGNAPTTTYPAGVFPREITASPDERSIFITDYASNAVQVIDTASLQPG